MLRSLCALEYTNLSSAFDPCPKREAAMQCQGITVWRNPLNLPFQPWSAKQGSNGCHFYSLSNAPVGDWTLNLSMSGWTVYPETTENNSRLTEAKLTSTLLLFSPPVLQYQFGEDMEASLLQPLEASLQKITNSYCGRTSHLFTKRLGQSIRSVQWEGRPWYVHPGPHWHLSTEEEEGQKKLDHVISLHIWFWHCGIEEVGSLDAHLGECFLSNPSR